MLIRGLVVGKIFSFIDGTASQVQDIQGEFFDGFSKIVNETEKHANEIEQTKQDIQNQSEEMKKQGDSIFGTVADVMKQTQDEYDKEKIESEKRSFNLAFELRDGTVWNTTVQQVIDMVIESNQKNDRKISVKYNDTITQDAAELRQMKRNFDSSKKYEIYLEYDNDGYVNQVVIEKI